MPYVKNKSLKHVAFIHREMYNKTDCSEKKTNNTKEIPLKPLLSVIENAIELLIHMIKIKIKINMWISLLNLHETWNDELLLYCVRNRVK